MPKQIRSFMATGPVRIDKVKNNMNKYINNGVRRQNPASPARRGRRGHPGHARVLFRSGDFSRWPGQL